MDAYLEIAVPLQTKAVTFFFGTGLSKFVTDGVAPSWLELIEDLTKNIDSSRRTLRNNLFNIADDGEIVSPKFDLSICAQILELEYMKDRSDFKQAVVDVINKRINDDTVKKRKASRLKSFFKKHDDISYITTNYDTLLNDYILGPYSRVIVDGSPIPKIKHGQNIYHIHGCLLRPSSIILTINDYFKFQHRDNYFSRKLSTLLQENTVVIVGYSLGDFNLNRIFNEAQVSKVSTFRRNNIFLVSRESVAKNVKEYYSFSYGINVIDDVKIEDFFDELDSKEPAAKAMVSEVEALDDILDGSSIYTDDFLKLGNSLSDILLQASTRGIDSSDERLIDILIGCIKRKKEFTRASGAWDQYTHLADWLVEFATIVKITSRELKDTYLDIVKYSFSTMHEDTIMGYAWDAFRVWKNRFQEIIPENQRLIINYAKRELSHRTTVKSLLQAVQ